MNEIEKVIRNYTMFSRENMIYKVELYARNEMVKSQIFDDVFKAFCYMATTEIHNEITKLNCFCWYKFVAYSSSDESIIFSVMLNARSGLIGIESFDDFIIEDIKLNTGDIIKCNNVYMVYLGFDGEKFHFISENEFDLTFDALPSSENILPIDCENNLITSVSLTLQNDGWYYHRWKLDYHLYNNMCKEMYTIISNDFKAIKKGKSWFYSNDLNDICSLTYENISYIASTLACSMCGDKLSYWDYEQNFYINRIIGYGSKYDMSKIEMRLCCDCCDKVIDAILPMFKNNPLKENYYGDL